jgi:uncharacterized membrane protein HdeD (DUF308 family)
VISRVDGDGFRGCEEFNVTEARTKRPSGAVITGWVAVLFCGALAFLNATIAAEVGFRVFFLALGTILVVSGICLIARWYRVNSKISKAPN